VYVDTGKNGLAVVIDDGHANRAIRAAFATWLGIGNRGLDWTQGAHMARLTTPEGEETQGETKNIRDREGLIIQSTKHGRTPGRRGLMVY
jgi:hypothetical protein